MIKIRCVSLFDITQTGVTRQRSVSFPYVSPTGITINDEKELVLARNQQRNLDTLLQLIGMRTQMFNMSQVTTTTDVANELGADIAWTFTFDIEPNSQWTQGDDDLYLLKADSNGTPMLTGLTEKSKLNSCIDATGAKPNVVYYAI